MRTTTVTTPLTRARDSAAATVRSRFLDGNDLSAFAQALDEASRHPIQMCLSNEHHNTEHTQSGQNELSALRNLSPAHPTPVTPVDWAAVARTFAAAIPSPSSDTPIAPSNIRVKEPETFDGSRSKDVRTFIAQIDSYVRDTPEWTDEHHKVRVCSSFLRGQAHRFVSSHLALSEHELEKPEHAWLRDFDAYKAKLLTTFSDPDQAASDARKLVRLRQTGAAWIYVAQFRRLSHSLNWGSNALKFYFIEGLSEEIKDELARLDKVEDFEKLVDRVVTLDNRAFYRRLERNGNARASLTPHRAPASLPSALPVAAEDRMQIDASRKVASNAAGSRARGPLTPSEKRYRKVNNLCGYCGSKGHCANDNDCPALKAKNARSLPARRIVTVTIPSAHAHSPTMEDH
ncbi:hypothetical protein JCM11491_002662 [Sporobolomyces phaffii]